MQPGAVCADGPVGIDGSPSWFLQKLGNSFKGVLFTAGRDSVSSETLARLETLKQGPVPVEMIIVTEKAQPSESLRGLEVVVDVEGLLRRRYDSREGTFYLIRPDQHVCARWRDFDVDKVQAALARACCL